ncbi:MAG TPA: multidrug ABC transporter ATP-binding protein [Erysipelotrichaceae bacterium]|nr:ABC transporter ATP-binding protein [Erysipelotrichaceae bacterium]OGS57764.1 MAG: multidrug ABC transporter ATP-binding protein [Firmicutes bacterium GWE2_51_13]HAO60469.1 multidrug ABC transporter ATP-binding protein [Erysipelotrichaceae bacterium]HBZ40588.1 multidrug ABC transporter ATP-binding protein [Erysipelotrichaceae bacterium]
MKKVFSYLRFYWMQVIAIVVLVFTQTMLELELPDYMSDIINTGIVKQDIDFIYTKGFQMLAIALTVATISVITSFLSARVGSGLSNKIRKDLYLKIENFSLIEFDKYSTASLITRNTNDVQQVQMMITMMLRMVVSAPLYAIIGFQKANALNSSMSWIFAVVIPLLVFMIASIFTFVTPRFERVQKLTDKLNLTARENLTGIRVIRAFNAQDTQADKFNGVNIEVRDNNTILQRIMSFMMPGIMLIMSFTTILIVWVGAEKINTGSLLIGDMMAFLQYATQMLFSFVMMSMVFIMYPRAAVSGKRIAEVLNTKPQIIDPDQPVQAVRGIGEVKFENVCFRYPEADEDVLHDITFTARPGKTTAFIGSTGSGKSTLVNLIPRFYDVCDGSIKIDGVDIRAMKQSDLHDKIGYIPQKGVLFSGTIASNLTYGRPEASQEELEDAASIAQAKDFILEKEGGYDYLIAQGATNVSGGQKQRLSIARALVKKPEIYIFDDSFSALDFKTDSALRKAIHEKLSDATVLIVGQRVSTIMSADQIVVLENGSIAGIGTHRDLLKNCPVYYEIAASQLTKEELA